MLWAKYVARTLFGASTFMLERVRRHWGSHR